MVMTLLLFPGSCCSIVAPADDRESFRPRGSHTRHLHRSKLPQTVFARLVLRHVNGYQAQAAADRVCQRIVPAISGNQPLRVVIRRHPDEWLDAVCQFGSQPLDERLNDLSLTMRIAD